MITEMECLNMLPADLSKFQDVNESSFFAGMKSNPNFQTQV